MDRSNRMAAILAAALLVTACGRQEKARSGQQALERCVGELERTIELLARPMEISITREQLESGAPPPQSSGLPSRHELLGRLSGACRDVLPRCGSAMDQVARGELPPQGFIPACAPRYCPDLPAPKPALCGAAGTSAGYPAATEEAAAAMIRFQWGAVAEPFAARARLVQEKAAAFMSSSIQQIDIAPR